MLHESTDGKDQKARNFQVLFLKNDSSQEVEIHEVKDVDFFTVWQRLENGESVFITSKDAQKVNGPRGKDKPARSFKTKLVTAFYFDRV
jgi:hypothetical protein